MTIQKAGCLNIHKNNECSRIIRWCYSSSSIQLICGRKVNTKTYINSLIISPTHVNEYSQFRQIPDNQEVFVDMNTQQSLIFELLEQVEATNEQVAE